MGSGERLDLELEFEAAAMRDSKAESHSFVQCEGYERCWRSADRNERLGIER